jgi:SulP family sulfate permease
VLAGFSQAAALLIIASQVPALLGLKGSLASIIQAPRFDFTALCYGVGSLLLFVGGRRFVPRVPMVLLVLAASAGLSWWSGYSRTGSVIGHLPAGFPSLYLPAWPEWSQFQSILAPALVVALVSSLEMAASAKIESQRDGKRWDANQDLVGQGVGKLASALSGSFPTSTSFSRSAITLYAGAKTGWATVIATGFVLVVLLVLTPALQHVPRAVLAAVVVAAVMSLFRPHTFVRFWRIDRIEGVTALVTFGVTLLTSPRIYWGVLAGVVLGLAHFLYMRLHPRIIEAGRHPDGSMRDRHLWKLPPLAPHVYALRMDAELDFASATAFERAIVEHLVEHPSTRDVLLLAQPINRVDTTGVEVFMAVRSMLAARDVTLHLSGLKLPVERVLEKAGALAPDTHLRIYRTDDDAVAALSGSVAPAAT